MDWRECGSWNEGYECQVGVRGADVALEQSAISCWVLYQPSVSTWQAVLGTCIQMYFWPFMVPGVVGCYLRNHLNHAAIVS